MKEERREGRGERREGKVNAGNIQDPGEREARFFMVYPRR